MFAIENEEHITFIVQLQEITKEYHYVMVYGGKFVRNLLFVGLFVYLDILYHCLKKVFFKISILLLLPESVS